MNRSAIRTGLGGCILSALVVLPSIASAHFLWACVDSKSRIVRIGLQETPAADALPLGERASLVKAWSVSQNPLSVKVEGNSFEVGPLDTAVGASLDYGVIDRSGSGRGLFWLKYYAKACFTESQAKAKLGLPLEITAEPVDKGTLLTVTLDGKPVNEAEITIAGAGQAAGKTGSSGHFLIRNVKGNLAVRALLTQNVKGQLNGKPYDLVRIYSSLTIGQQVAKTKPLTQLIREAFGNDHELVGKTTFIETLMSGKLTKPQLVAHLEQRAIVHQELDKIMRSGPALSQYGSEQQEVLRLLREDMKSLSETWPVEDQSWPVTVTFLKQLRESAKKGPYFALGVFHVYYGGITHGGRDIGAQIERTVGPHLSYYLKSDGYASYVKAVNRIVDPADQHEMIRGGVAAYRYIMDVNNSDLFSSAEKR